MDIQTRIDELVTALAAVRGVNAVVLGGSRARGSHTAASDYDLCLYYDPAEPLDLDALAAIATAVDDTHRADLLTPIGGWGPWINGGGWLTIDGAAVDLLYRDLARVDAIVAACRRGEVEIAYQPGHPFGFVSAIYLAEVALCRVLWTRNGRVAALKEQSCPYPPALKQALLDKFAWEIAFSLQIARKSASRGDVTYAAGAAFRGVACLLQVLFALNTQYWMNEKGAVDLAQHFARTPANLKTRIEDAFGMLSADAVNINMAVDILEDLAGDVAALVD